MRSMQGSPPVRPRMENVVNEHPINHFQDEYNLLRVKEERRVLIKQACNEALEEDRFWFTAYMALMLNEMGYEWPKQVRR